ncbi:MAG TPA: LuxR C-terminal-related transcriptional regulator, partial [Haloferula sp.]
EALGKILSRREQEVLSQIISGKTSREIADFYGIGLRTVEFHRANVMAKFGASNTAELLSLARGRGVA